MSQQFNPLRLNVGFIIHEDVGYSRTFEFDFPTLHLSSDFEIADAAGAARFSRTPQGLLAEVHFSGRAQSECVRCLDAIDLPIATDFTELYAFDARSSTESELYVPESGIIDLAPLVREYLILELPIKPLCRPDCRGLCPVCGENLNDHPDHAHEDEDVDPRLSGLRDLLDKH